MKKLIVMMLALVVAFSFTACKNDTPQPGNEGSINVPSPAGAVPEEIYAEVYNLESIVLDEYRDGQASILEESSIYRCYNADDVLIASVEDVDGTEVITVAMDGEHFEAGIKVVRKGPNDFCYYGSDDKWLSNEAGSEMGQLIDSSRRVVSSFSRSYSCTSTIGGDDVTFDNKVDMCSEIRLDPEAPNGITEGIVTLRHSVALSGYDGLSSYVLYGQMTYPDTMSVVIEVDGTAYSLAKDDDIHDLYGLIRSWMG